MAEKRTRGVRHTPVDAWKTEGGGIDTDVWLRVFQSVSRPHETPDDALAFYTRLFLEAPVAMVILSPDLAIADANIAAQKSLKRTLKSIRGKPFQRFVAKMDRFAFAGIGRDVIASRLSVTRPLRLVSGTGETEVLLTACTLRDAEGNPEYIHIVYVYQGENISLDVL